MRILLTILLVAYAAPSLMSQQTSPAAQENPFLIEWRTPFGMPPFGDIKEDHFLPAYDQAIAASRAEIGAIVNNQEPPTFANTIVALDANGALLDKVGAVFSNLNSAETNPRLQDIAKQISPKLSALEDDIVMNLRLFARVKAVWESRDQLKLDPDQRRLLNEAYKDFVRGGANLDAAKQARLRKVNEELSMLSIRFGENVLKETNNYRLVISKKEDLAGLPQGVIDAGAEAAKSAKLAGSWVYTLHSPSIWPFLTYAENRDLRKQILNAYAMRGDHDDAQDNKSILVQIATLRAERAQLLGSSSHAAFVLEEQMAKTPKGVYGLLDQLWTPAIAMAKKEASEMQTMIRKEGKSFTVEPADWRLYADKIMKERYSFDETEASQYFVLDNVREGAFEVAKRLYGITFKERTDLPKYHSEVKTFEVIDGDGSHLGVYVVDYHPRPGKRGGAWASRFRGQQIKDGKDIRPLVVNVCNFTRPTESTPALLTLDEVETLFHEFGHALHSLFARIRYKSIGSVPRDFVELPSQIMENWALQKEVLKTYAKHWKTGEAMPDALIEKIHNSAKFNQGFMTVEYLAASYLDLAWHSRTETTPVDARVFEKQTLDRIGLIPEIISRYRSPYFQHIFAGGYSSGYYSYIWSEVLDQDAFAAFKETSLFDQATATSFRKNILEKGGTEEAMTMYKKFRGREPKVEPLLQKRGLM